MRKEFVKILNKELDIAYVEIAKVLMLHARSTHRYITRTGNLRASTFSDYDPASKVISSYVTTAAEYGKYVIYGHGTWAPDPFIEQAIKDNETYIDQQIWKAVDRAWDKYCSTLG